MDMASVVKRTARTCATLMARTLAPATIAVAMLSASALAQPAQPAQPRAMGVNPVSLEAVGPQDPGAMRTDVGTPTTLTVAKKNVNGGMPGEKVDWSIAGPGSASLSATQTTTSTAADGQEPGIASTQFTARKAGDYVVTARSQSNPGCSPVATCATFIRRQFALAVTGEVSESDSHTGRDVGIALGSLAAAAAVLGHNGRNDQAAVPTRTLSIVSGNNQSAPSNTPLAAPLVVQAKNDGNLAAQVTINWSASGGAVLSSPISFTDGNGIGGVRVLSTGPGSGPVTVTATRADNPAIAVQFTINIVNPALLKISGDGQSVPVNTQAPQPLVVQAVVGSTPQSGIGIIWVVQSGDATINNVSNGGQTNSGGYSNATINIGPTPGPVVVKATRSDNPSLSQIFTLNGTLIRSLAIVSGDNQTGNPNAALPAPLAVHATDNGNDAAGVTINWVASGGATLSSNSTVTDSAGQASVTVTDLGPGPDPITVTAVRADDPSAMVAFHENIVPPTLTITGGDGQTGLIGSMATTPLQVTLVDGASNPVVGQTINWTVSSGSAILASGTSTTDSGGVASNTFTYGNTAGPIVIKASAYNGSQTVQFNETAVTADSLQIISGDAQSAAPGSTLPVPLVVHVVPPAGVTGPMSGIPITFTVTSGSATVSPTTVLTDVNGDASATVTLGLTPGPVTVLAQVTGGGASATFNATVTGTLVTGALTIVSGDGQILTPGVASAPMVVELRGNGSPLAGQTITWATSSGTVANPSTVTDSNGRASTTVTITSPGPLTVTANFAAYNEFLAASVAFQHNSTLGSLSTLDSNQAQVGQALDNACAGLRGDSTLTPEQQDLLNQCLALTASSGIAPAAVANAIEELLPKVTQAQSDTAKSADTAQFNNIKGRIAAFHAGNVGSSMGGLTLSGPNGSVPLFGLGVTLLGLADEPAKPKAEEGFDRWGFFASGNIGRGDSRPGISSPGYAFDVHGLTAGVDYRQSNNLVLGVALGYTRQGTNLDGGSGSVRMNGYSLSGYATWYRNNNWYVDGVLTFGHNNYDHKRRISYSLPLPGGGSTTVNQLARASTDGNDSTATITFGRDFQQKAWSYGVYGRGVYSRQEFGGFTETLDASLAGSGLGLRIDSHAVTALSSVLGGKINWAHSTSWGVIVPHFELEWQHEFRGNPDSFRAFFVDDPTGTPIIIVGDGTDTNYFRASLGTSFVFSRGRSGFLLYEKVLGRSGITQDTFSLGFRMEF